MSGRTVKDSQSQNTSDQAVFQYPLLFDSGFSRFLQTDRKSLVLKDRQMARHNHLCTDTFCCFDLGYASEFSSLDSCNSLNSLSVTFLTPSLWFVFFHIMVMPCFKL